MIARSGLNKQLREAGLIGNSVSPSERVRGGALTVLCAFALFVIPGVGFAKISEHWDQSIHRGSRHLSHGARDVARLLQHGAPAHADESVPRGVHADHRDVRMPVPDQGS